MESAYPWGSYLTEVATCYFLVLKQIGMTSILIVFIFWQTSKPFGGLANLLAD